MYITKSKIRKHLFKKLGGTREKLSICSELIATLVTEVVTGIKGANWIIIYLVTVYEDYFVFVCKNIVYPIMSQRMES